MRTLSCRRLCCPIRGTVARLEKILRVCCRATFVAWRSVALWGRCSRQKLSCPVGLDLCGCLCRLGQSVSMARAARRTAYFRRPTLSRPLDAVCAVSVERARRPDRGAADFGSDVESASESEDLPPPPPSQRPPLGFGGPPPPPPLEVAASPPVAAAAPISPVGVSEIVPPSQSVDGVLTSPRDDFQAPLRGSAAASAAQAEVPELVRLLAGAAAHVPGAFQSQAPIGVVCCCDGASSGRGDSWASRV